MPLGVTLDTVPRGGWGGGDALAWVAWGLIGRGAAVVELTNYCRGGGGRAVFCCMSACVVKLMIKAGDTGQGAGLVVHGAALLLRAMYAASSTCPLPPQAASTLPATVRQSEQQQNW